MNIGVNSFDLGTGQQGLNFIFDSLRTSLCLQHDVKKIASACAFLTVVFLRKMPQKTDKDKLAKLFGILSISERSLNAICTQVVEVYIDNNNKATNQLIQDLVQMGHVTLPAKTPKTKPAPLPLPPPQTA